MRGGWGRQLCENFLRRKDISLWEKPKRLIHGAFYYTASTTCVLFWQRVIKKHPSASSALHTLTPSPLPSLSFTCHQILKLYGWEPSFQAQVEGIRGKELKVMRKFAYLSSVSTFIFSCAPALVSSSSQLTSFTNGSSAWSFFFLFFF